MEYVKMLGLLAVAMTALAAFAASASAATLTSPTGTTYTGTITAVNEDNLTFDGSFVTNVCEESHFEGKVEQHGVGVTVKSNISKWTFTNKGGGPCNYPITVVSPGSFEIHAVSEVTNKEGKKEIVGCNTAGQTECTGTFTSSGAKISIATSVGTCIFTTNATDIGTLTPTNDTGGTATLDIGGPEGKTGRIPRTEGNFLCGTTSQWTGSYSVTTPDELWIDG